MGFIDIVAARGRMSFKGARFANQFGNYTREFHAQKAMIFDLVS
jgi:hypothetical protein